LKKDSLGSKFRSSFHDVEPPVGPAHEDSQLFELIRSLAKLQGAFAAQRR
jgi:hypothetical protein